MIFYFNNLLKRDTASVTKGKTSATMGIILSVSSVIFLGSIECSLLASSMAAEFTLEM